MKKLLLLLAIALPCYGQLGNVYLVHFPGVPTAGPGQCTQNQQATNDANGDQYNCKNGAWYKIGPGAAGSADFDTIGSGTNTTAAMVVGSGASIDVSGTGTNKATSGDSATSFFSTGTLEVGIGGLGLSSYTQGDLLYASGSTTIAKLAKDTNATRYLSNTGTTNNPAWAQVNVANGITGTVPVANGGTAQTSYTDGQLLIGNSSGNTLTKASLTAGTNITITPGNGSITIAASGGGSGCSTSGSANGILLDDGAGGCTTSTASISSGNISTPGSATTGAGGSNAGAVDLVGNSADTTITTGAAGWAGNTSATSTPYRLRMPTAENSAVAVMAFAAASGHYSQGSFYGASGTGTTFCLTTSCVMTTPNLGVPSAVDLTNATALPTRTVAQGGTGLTTLTIHALYVGNTTSAPTALSVGATNTVLHGNTGADPSFSAVAGADMTNNTVTATQLAAQYSKGSCTEVWGGSGTSFAMASGDDAISNNTCYNDSGVTRTITAVKCRSDNAGNTTVLTPTFGSAGTGTAILTGTLTCGNSYAYSATGTLNNTAWTTGTGIDPGMSTVGNATSIAMIVEYTF
jgi:hypothetical protein